MTLAAAFWPRRFPQLPPATERLFEVEPGTKLLAHCHWQAVPQSCPTVVLVHGLEGSSSSKYMLGIAEKAFARGWNAIRVNQRNCGGSEQLTPTLYNSGLSADYAAIIRELSEQDGLPEIFVAGYSMGGNLVLKMTGEFCDHAPSALVAVAAVSPSFELAASADAFEQLQNLPYAWHFLLALKRRYRRKVRLFPQHFKLRDLGRVRTLRQFDDLVTAPHSGYRDSADYYFRASAARVVAQIRVPSLLLSAQDDPMIPFAPFQSPAIRDNPAITLEAPARGGHCGFINSSSGALRFWAECCVLDFFAKLSRVESRPATIPSRTDLQAND